MHVWLRECVRVAACVPAWLRGWLRMCMSEWLLAWLRACMSEWLRAWLCANAFTLRANT